MARSDSRVADNRGVVEFLARLAALCLALAGAEMLHGIARTLLLARRLGARRAKQWSILSGSALAFGVCWLLVPGLGLRDAGALVALGLFLAAFMAAFDVAVGRLAMKLPWRTVLAEFDLRAGGLLPLGLLALAAAPLLVMAARG